MQNFWNSRYLYFQTFWNYGNSLNLDFWKLWSIYLCKDGCVHASLFVWMHICMYVCKQACMCLCMYESMYVHLYSSMYTHTYIHKCMHIYTIMYVCLHTYLNICIHSNIHVCIHPSYIHIHSCVPLPICMQSYMSIKNVP